MDNIRKFLGKDRFAAHVGIELVRVSEGRAETRLRIDSNHLNGAGIVHGAVVFSLADFTFAAASNSHGTLAVAINANISFMKAAREGDTLTARAEEVAINPKLASYDIRVTDADGALVAVFQGMVYRKKDPVG